MCNIVSFNRQIDVVVEYVAVWRLYQLWVSVAYSLINYIVCLDDQTKCVRQKILHPINMKDLPVVNCVFQQV